MIYTEADIENIVLKIKGTHVKRNNARRRLKSESNKEVMIEIDKIKSEIRKLKVVGVKEWDLSGYYSDITKLELRKI